MVLMQASKTDDMRVEYKGDAKYAIKDRVGGSHCRRSYDGDEGSGKEALECPVVGAVSLVLWRGERFNGELTALWVSPGYRATTQACTYRRREGSSIIDGSLDVSYSGRTDVP